ncbi:MAG: SDR family oxidoreductase [Nitrospinae bacterium]|nr:SDR family oxidoreductase [Nitrospinota bacterium]
MKEKQKKKFLFCFGMGFTAKALVQRLPDSEWDFSGTFRPSGKNDSLPGTNLLPFDGSKATPDIEAALSKATHLLVTIPPQPSGDVVLQNFGSKIKDCKNLQWIGYISSTGVYGDTRGEWVDESSILQPETELHVLRVKAEEEWLKSGYDCPVMLFRCVAIYGPGRNLLLSVKQGRARRIEKPGLVFSRIHVEDLAQVLEASIKNPKPGEIYNVSDDRPSPPSETVEYACRLLKVEPPPLIPYESAELTEIARGFYKTCKRVDNKKIKEELGVKLKYPDYKSGLDAIFKSM